MHRIYLKFIVAAIFLQAFAVSAQSASDEAQRLELARAIVKINYEVMDPKSLTLDTLSQMQGQFKEMIEAPESKITKDKQGEALKIVQEELAAYVDQIVPLYEKMQQMTTDLYAQKYSLDELRALHSFINSDLGRKNLSVVSKELPALMGKMMQDVTPQAVEMSRRLQGRLAPLRK